MGLNQGADQSDVVNNDLDHTIVSVGTSAVELKVGASRMVQRQELILYNDSSATVYIGKAAVSTSGSNKGFPLGPNETMNMQIGDAVAVYAIAASASNDVFVMECA